ncbi:hypothetical protein RFI_36461 [Reticulomyxa filosa]|uniref:Uncharacterized protein n=1 Tax=Reticulomyxa filosa TaxID=46433 RepID=X6LHB6_RETFI|nr:hypothetical protein RFI_36461 [Reticulomyxa filosa]|eukprot:ETO00979.1 hypothetical protein RFI_36461 [Reticulomyxa filosa]
MINHYQWNINDTKCIINSMNGLQDKSNDDKWNEMTLSKLYKIFVEKFMKLNKKLNDNKILNKQAIISCEIQPDKNQNQNIYHIPRAYNYIERLDRPLNKVTASHLPNFQYVLNHPDIHLCIIDQIKIIQKFNTLDGDRLKLLHVVVQYLFCVISMKLNEQQLDMLLNCWNKLTSLCRLFKITYSILRTQHEMLRDDGDNPVLKNKQIIALSKKYQKSVTNCFKVGVTKKYGRVATI